MKEDRRREEIFGRDEIVGWGCAAEYLGYVKNANKCGIFVIKNAIKVSDLIVKNATCYSDFTK